MPVDGIPIFDGDLAAAVDLCGELIESGRGARVATANVDFLALARREPVLASHLKSSTMVVADGMPVAWLARLLGGRKTRRVPGVDLAREICCRVGGTRELRVALYGASPAVIAGARTYIESLSAGSVVVFAESPPFRPLEDEEKAAFQGGLAAARPDLVLVALGCPAQETLIADWFQVAPRAVWIGVGGTLDFFAGRRARAPRAVQALGLEWLFRMGQEPRRLASRYLGRDLPALAGIVQRSIVSAARGSR